MILLTLLSLIIVLLITIAPSFVRTDVSSFTLNQKLNLDKVLDANKSIELVFFGYSGCIDVCTPRLKKIASWYKNSQNRDKIQIRFLDISQPHEKDLPDRFAKSFHKESIGVYLNRQELREYTKAFNVYFSKALFDEYEYDHTTNIYILNKKRDETKVLKHIYTSYPYSFNEIELDIEEITRKTYE
ncbi:MAG: SCO family protein [Campylobacterota bacterium]|nr:SCO family protein [Campylobacterota bacterium]